MANDKDFKVKGSIEVGGAAKLTVGTVTSNNVDLSTGNYFIDTPSGESTYTFSNPGDTQAFQLELTGGTAEVAQNFSTTLYTGTGAWPSGGSNQIITNGIDLASDGGLVWIKARSTDTRHALFDTERGPTKMQNSAETAADITVDSRTFVSFNSDGFTLGDESGGYGRTNVTGETYVSWTFRKATGFFDCVTYTGDGVAGRTVSHNLGTNVGTLIVKKTSGTDNWFVWHRNLTDATYRIILNLTSGEQQQTNAWNSTAPTSTEFTLGDNANVNENGASYVAYLFAHDEAADGLIQCGSYTGTGVDNPINIGWRPQWILFKNTDLSTEQWFIIDSERGEIAGGNDARLEPSRSVAEAYGSVLDFTDTGFTALTSDDKINGSGRNYIYIAIRAASDPDITWPAAVNWTGGSAPASPAVGETDVYTFVTDDGGTTYTGIQSADNLS